VTLPPNEQLLLTARDVVRGSHISIASRLVEFAPQRKFGR
jgi:hypothetical protein